MPGGRVNTDFEGVSAHVLSREDLIANKRAAGRPQDLADVRIWRSRSGSREEAQGSPRLRRSDPGGDRESRARKDSTGQGRSASREGTESGPGAWRARRESMSRHRFRALVLVAAAGRMATAGTDSVRHVGPGYGSPDSAPNLSNSSCPHFGLLSPFRSSVTQRLLNSPPRPAHVSRRHRSATGRRVGRDTSGRRNGPPDLRPARWPARHSAEGPRS